MMTDDIKTINDYQKQIYLDFEKDTTQKLLDLYGAVLQKTKQLETLKILDIGGAGGFFAYALSDYFSDKTCEIYVLDTMEYPTWTTYSKKITFIKNSADNLNKLFDEYTFDLVFANRVFHHFVRNSWKKSIDGMADILKQIRYCLKLNGFFCVVDLTYDGFLYDKITSKLIYTLTSLKSSSAAFVFRALGAKTAGVGVCFLSKNMMLDLFTRADFQLETYVEDSETYIHWYQNILLLCRKMRANALFICKKG